MNEIYSYKAKKTVHYLTEDVYLVYNKRRHIFNKFLPEQISQEIKLKLRFDPFAHNQIQHLEAQARAKVLMQQLREKEERLQEKERKSQLKIENEKKKTDWLGKLLSPKYGQNIVRYHNLINQMIGNKVYLVKIGNRHSKNDWHLHEQILRCLDKLGIPYTVGNDAPRGGAQGEYITINPNHILKFQRVDKLKDILS
jgi:hypothetical protein